MDQNDTSREPGTPGHSTPGEELLGTMGRRGLSAVGAAFLGALGPVGALLAGTAPAEAQSVNDIAILNFALQLEYLEAEFYLRAVTGQGLPASMVTGTGTAGGVNGGAIVPFTNAIYGNFADNLALNEQQHVATLRSALGSNAASRPLIDLAGGFQAAATAAGVIQPGQVFNPFGDQVSFLLGSYIFEDVGVTAYNGAAPLIQNKSYLAVAASILAVEAFHGGTIRALLAQIGGSTAAIAQGISNLRSTASNASGLATPGPIFADQGVLLPSNLSANIAPTNGNGLVFSRSTSQVVNIVTLGNKGKGGFFPNGLNGQITS